MATRLDLDARAKFLVAFENDDVSLHPDRNLYPHRHLRNSFHVERESGILGGNYSIVFEDPSPQSQARKDFAAYVKNDPLLRKGIDIVETPDGGLDFNIRHGIQGDAYEIQANVVSKLEQFDAVAAHHEANAEHAKFWEDQAKKHAQEAARAFEELQKIGTAPTLDGDTMRRHGDLVKKYEEETQAALDNLARKEWMEDQQRLTLLVERLHAENPGYMSPDLREAEYQERLKMGFNSGVVGAIQSTALDIVEASGLAPVLQLTPVTKLDRYPNVSPEKDPIEYFTGQLKEMSKVTGDVRAAQPYAIDKEGEERAVAERQMRVERAETIKTLLQESPGHESFKNERTVAVVAAADKHAANPMLTPDEKQKEELVVKAEAKMAVDIARAALGVTDPDAPVTKDMIRAELQKQTGITRENLIARLEKAEEVSPGFIQEGFSAKQIVQDVKAEEKAQIALNYADKDGDREISGAEAVAALKTHGDAFQKVLKEAQAIDPSILAGFGLKGVQVASSGSKNLGGYNKPAGSLEIR